jgi:hypothetical protein
MGKATFLRDPSSRAKSLASPSDRPAKDPNLVSALTGHFEGSCAFTRYRTIDIDMKKDLVKILEGAK